MFRMPIISLHAAVGAVALTLAATVLSSQAAVACSVPHFNFALGQPTSTTMGAVGGRPCNIKLREGNGSVFRAIKIVKRPARGAVTVLNPLNVSYRGRPGYQGGDSFVFDLVGTRNGTPLTTRMTVAVSVTGGYGAVAPVGASSRGTQRASQQLAGIPADRRMKCLQQAGASIDPVTKRWTFYTTERDGMSRTDAFRMCLAGGDRAKANTIPVRERKMNPGSGPPSPY